MMDECALLEALEQKRLQAITDDEDYPKPVFGLPDWDDDDEADLERRMAQD